MKTDDSRKPMALTRKEFITLTFTLVGTAGAACSSSSSNNDAAGGAGGGSAGAGGAGGHAGVDGGAGGAGGTGANSCADPLPEEQVALGNGTDTNSHVHHVMVASAALAATTDQMINTDLVFAHMHAVTLTAADLAMLRSGGTVTVTSAAAGTPAHTHSYVVACHGLPDGGVDGQVAD
jgi:hypothetical protein